MKSCALTVLALIAGCGGDDDDGGGLEIQIDSGKIVGTQQGEARAFLGIPFAAPPVGDLRFKPPQPVEPWSEPRDVVQTGSECPQSFSLTGTGGEEDCLFLNVWAPNSGSNKAVMVWFHGGAFVFGSGGETYYNGKHLAETYDVIVVTVNYRLGAFGFMAHPALAAEDPAYPSSGDWGLDDQRAAMQWVQRNIAKFGGDPKNVTLFGESAGGYGTCAHYLSPRSADLFARVISESGICSIMFTEPSKAQAEAIGMSIADKLGCSGTGAAAAACLRHASMEDLMKSTALPPAGMQTMTGGPLYFTGDPIGMRPNVDGFVVEKPQREAFLAGQFDPKPILIGGNQDEGTLFHSSIFAQEVPDETDYRAALERRFGAANVDAIVAKYPIASYPSPNRAIGEVTGDSFFACSARRTARALAAKGAPTYYYDFQQPVEGPFLPGLGVFHSSEIPFVFGTDPAFPLGKVGASGAAVAEAMQGYWTRFAKTGDPNGGGAPMWTPYDRASDTHLVFGATILEVAHFKDALCDFWDGVVPPT